MSAVDWLGEMRASPPVERGDAARNRVLVLDAARRLVAERGADAVTMDDIAAAAGVGKGTVFRRFGSRAGLMMVLLDQDEQASQQAFLFGPPPLGPDAPPLERLLAFGRDRLRFAHTHHELLSAANRDSQTRYGSPVNAPYMVLRMHVRVLLGSAGPVYFAEAILLGIGFLAPALGFRRRKGVAQARRVLRASLLYLPLLLLLLLLDGAWPWLLGLR